MKATGRFIALALALGVLVGGCTDDEDGGEPTGGTAGGTGGTGPTGEETGPTPVQSGPATVGTYEYANAGLRVVMHIEGTEGTLEVDNGTERELPRPDFYILHALNATRIEGDVAAPEPIPAGETATFDIAFEGIRVRDIGAIALLFGADNYGLFVRTA
jgi:hypothetical protein